MIFLTTFKKTILDALFPLSKAEEGLMTLSAESAWNILPRAPKYSEPIPDVYSIFAYKDERVAKLVWNIKYKRSVHAVEIGGFAMWNTLRRNAGRSIEEFGGHLGLSEGDSAESCLAEGELDVLPAGKNGVSDGSSILLPAFLLIPVPITKRRRKERGYNQCELLVDEISKLDNVNKFSVRKNLLIRTQHASRQTLKDRADRLESAHGIFSVEKIELKKEVELNPEFTKIPIIVIDDVVTTGSTIREAMQTLIDAGFEHVFGLSLAH